MRDFFKPWRRKLGCVTLVLACVFAGVWVRSLYGSDSTLFPTGKALSLQLISRSATLTIRRFESPYRVRPLIGNADRIGLVGAVKLDEMTTADIETTLDEIIHAKVGNPYSWKFRFWGIEYGHLDVRGMSLRVTVWKLPFWSIVIPLTLLSAWLLLSKQPPAKVKVQP